MERLIQAGAALRHQLRRILSEGSRTDDELVIADCDFDMIREVRHAWQFFRDRRPDSYGPLTED